MKQKRPFYKRIFTISSLVISSAVAALLYVLAGGSVPLVADPRSLVAAGLAAGAYFLVNSALISGAVSFESGRPFRSVIASWQWLFLQVLTTLGLGIVMALTYNHGFGSEGFFSVGLLLVLPWYSVYFYAEKSREVAAYTERLKGANTDLEKTNQALDHRVRSLRALHNIGITLNSSQSSQEILQAILNSVVELVGADTTAIFLTQNQKRLTIAGQIGLSKQYVEAPEMALDGSGLHALRERRPLIMDKNNYQPAMLSGAAEREGISAAASLPLWISGQVIGALDVCFKSEHAFTEDELGLLRTLTEQAAIAIHNTRLTQQIHEGYLSTMHALVAAVDAKDPYTRGHSESVRLLAVETGRQLGLSSQQIDLLNVGALFHDIGKIGISETILNKPGRLSEEEWAEMRKHPAVGEHILSKVAALVQVLPIVRHHHERFDGAGYPDGICAQEDVLAAVVSVCDAYQAMTSDRPYRKVLSHLDALDEIRRYSGTQFVPEVAEAFVAAVENQTINPLRLYPSEPVLLFQSKTSVDKKSLN